MLVDASYCPILKRREYGDYISLQRKNEQDSSLAEWVGMKCHDPTFTIYSYL